MKSKAFTLIELIVIIAVVGILTAFVIVSLGESKSLALDAKRKSDVDSIYKSLAAKGVDSSYVEGTFEINESSPQPFKDFLSTYLKTLPEDPSLSRHYIYTSNGKDFSVLAMLNNGTCIVKSSNEDLFPLDTCTRYAEGGLGFVSNYMILNGQKDYDLFYSINPKYSSSLSSQISSAIVCLEELTELGNNLPPTTELLNRGIIMGIVDNKGEAFRLSLSEESDKDKWYYCQSIAYSQLEVTNPGSLMNNPNTLVNGFNSETKYAVNTPLSGGINASQPIINPHSPAGGEEVGSTTPNFVLTPNQDGSVSIDWIKGYASTHTIIRRQVDTPALNYSSGTNIYNGEGISYIDTGLSPDLYYCYSAWGYDDRTGTYSLGFAFACSSVPPSDPSNLSITRQFDSLTLSFVKGSGNASIIRRQVDTPPNNIDEGVQIYLGEDNTYQDNQSLSQGVNYCYSVWSYNNQTATLSSNKVSICSELFPLGSPSNPSLTNTTTTSMDLSFTKGPGATHTVIRRQINTAPTDKTQGMQVYHDSGTSFTDNNLLSDTNYCYSLWAYNDTTLDYSLEHVSSCNSTLALGEAGSNSSNISDTNILLFFTKGTGATHTVIRRQLNTAPTDRTQGIEVYNGEGTSYDDINLLPSTKYCYSLWAYNSNNGSYSSSPSSVCYDTKPSNVTNLSYDSLNYTSVDLLWTKGIGSTSTMIRKQTITPPAQITDGLLIYDGNDNSYLDPSLEQGNTYCYSLWAYDGNNYSPDKTSTCVTTSLVGVPQDISSSSVTNEGLTLSFTKGAGTDKTLIRRQINTAPSSRSEGLEVYDGTGFSIDEISLSPSTNYCYSLWGHDSITDSYSLTYNFYCVSTLTPVNGQCGSSDEGNFSSAPTTNLCSSGTASAVTGTGPWTWSCAGSNGGASDSCSANLIINGVCGTNAKTYETTDTSYAGTFCASGTASPSSPAFPGLGATVNWSCQGAHTGTNASCSAIRKLNGQCGSSDGGNFSSAPTANLCSSGTASAVTGTGPWTWSCAGSNGGASDSCSANKIINGVCGSSDGGNFSSAPTANLCSSGTASSVSGTGPWTWSCAGSNGGTSDSCSANLIINGVCGTNDKTYETTNTSYAGTFCASGTASPASPAFPGLGATVTWTCQGAHTGTSASCSAIRKLNGACGSSDGGNFSSAPTANLCSSGTASAVTGTGPWTWSCAGSNGGTSDSCSAYVNWLTSYTKRKPITVNNSSGVNLSNYQIKISVAYASSMQANFNDIRFTNNNDTQQLSYWIESKTDSSNAVVWVKVPSIPTTGTTIYMYYGNSSTSSASNGSNTFILFDHFSGDTELWNKTSASSGGTNITGGEAQVYSRSTSGSFGKFETKNSYPVTNVGIMTRYRIYITGSSCNYAAGITYIYPISTAWRLSSYGYTWKNSNFNDCFRIGTYEDNVHRPCGSWGPYIDAKINTTNDTIYAYKNNVHVYTGAIASTEPSLYSLYAQGADPNNYYTQYMGVDYFIIRQYINNEPMGVVGSEQSI